MLLDNGTMRRMGLLMLAFLCLLACTAFLFAQTDSEHQKLVEYGDSDGYAILSVLLEHHHNSSTTPALKISRETDSGLGADAFDVCSRSVPDEFKPAAGDFTEKNKQHLRLQKKFNLSFRYEFSHSRSPGSAGKPLYWVSAVGFDNSRNHAIAYVAMGCGLNCFGGTYYFFRKEKGIWKEVDGTKECEWMSYNREDIHSRSAS